MYIYIYVYIYICVYIYIYIYIYICIYVYICICIYIHIYTYMYIYIYIKSLFFFYCFFLLYFFFTVDTCFAPPEGAALFPPTKVGARYLATAVLTHPSHVLSLLLVVLSANTHVCMYINVDEYVCTCVFIATVLLIYIDTDKTQTHN